MVTRLLAIINGWILAAVFYSYRFAYFTMDDFDNIYWARTQTLPSMMWHNLNPLSDFFRPFGMTIYWFLWKMFDLHALPYHLFAWALHAGNVILVYVLISQITGSRSGAALGVMLFGFRANFADVYWNFGSIFDLLALFLMLVTLWIYIRKPLSYRSIVLIVLLYLLAIRSKEMAITLPAVLMFYDLCFRRKFDRLRLALYGCLFGMGLWFAFFKISTMAKVHSTDPYYMNFTALTLGRGFGWYFNGLYGTPLRWGAWLTIAAVLLCTMTMLKERRGIFFLGYLFVTLLPVVFLVNHRFDFYWYVPFFGIAGLVATLVNALEENLRRGFSPKAVYAAGIAAFLVVGAAHCLEESRRIASHLQLQREQSAEYVRFTDILSRLPQPGEAETVYYKTFPQQLAGAGLTIATQVALHRTDVKVEIVDTFPVPCRYCIDFVR